MNAVPNGTPTRAGAGPAALETVTTPDGRVSVDLPMGWETLHSPADGLAVVAVEPDQSGAFRTSFVLAVAPVEMSFSDWQKGTELYLRRELADYLLLDLDKPRVGGHPGGRRLATYATTHNESVTVESWSTIVDGLGVTLTATVATLRVAASAQLVDRVAASLAVRGREGATA